MTNLKLIIGNKNYSSWSLRPWILMKQFNIEFEEERVPLFTATADDELRPYFSDCKVPVLVDSDFTVWDSLSIMEYVSEKYLHGSAWPAEIQARALARSVSAEMHSSFTQLRSECPMNCREKFPDAKLSSGVERDIERIKLLWKRCKTAYGQGGEWLFGYFSIADAMFAPVVLRFIGFGVSFNKLESDYVDTLLKSVHIQAWIEAGRVEKEVIE
ncbi:MAG: glutathione S-transferase family protein [Thiohalomonadales bacterium]